jgi:hypothetical protein
MAKKTEFKDYTTADGKTWTKIGWKTGNTTEWLYNIQVGGTDLDPEAFNNSAIALVGMFLQHYTMEVDDKGRNYIEYHPEAESRIGAGISDIYGNNLRHQQVRPNERISIPSPEATAPFGARVKRHIRALEHIIKDKDGVVIKVFDIAYNSKINMTSQKARAIAFEKLVSKKLTVDIDDDILIRATADFRSRYGLLTDRRIPVPDYDFTKLFNMTYQPEKKAGLTTVKEARPGSLTKHEAFNHEMLMLLSIINEMNRLYVEKENYSDNVNRMYQYLTSFLNIVKKLSLKREIIKVGKDHMKARIFVLVPFLHYMIAKIVSEPLHDYLSPRHEYGVGFRWFGGGAKLLYDSLKGEEGSIIFTPQGTRKGPDTRTFFSDDIKGKDTKFKAKELVHLIMLTASVFDFEGIHQHFNSPAEKDAYRRRSTILNAMVLWLAMNTAFHTVNWDRSWRVMIGVLASGDYNTSHLNTLHMVLLVYAWCILTHKQEVKRIMELNLPPKKTHSLLKKAEEYRLAIKTGALCFKVQGDNIIWSVSDDIIDKMNHQTFDDFMALNDMSLKPSDAKQARSLIDEVDDKGEFVHDSPDFLQRHFLVEEYKGVHYVVPVRAFSDHVKSIYHNAGEMNDVHVYVAKLMSIVCDSMGANAKIYRWLRYYLSLFFLGDNDTPYFRKLVQEEMDNAENLPKRLYKYGMKEMTSSDLFLLAIDRDALFRRLVGIDVNIEDHMSTLNEFDHRPIPESR